jgi:small subunit ribosomal protein S4
MGDIKRKKNLFKRPRKLYDKQRIEEENKLVQKYGLKNKKEIWKADSKVVKIRGRAKALIPKTEEERQAFFNRLKDRGLNVKNTADALGLTKEDILKRRLQTFVVSKKLAKTPKEARQLIVHKKIVVDGKVVNIPSFHVDLKLEEKIKIRIKEHG